MSSVLLAGPSSVQQTPRGAPAGPPLAPAPARAPANNVLTVIAGIGVLMLAMGVGVLIGRSGATKQSATPPPQVISVGSSTAPAAPSGAGETTFTGDWPSGTNGYTVQLQSLPQSGTSTGAVTAAKAAASAKGAKNVGALKSEEFTTLPSGHYLIYSGVYHKRAEADKALGGLKKSFPSAAVIHVSRAGAGSTSEGAGSSPGSSAPGSSVTKPAPATVLESLKGSKGKSYEEKSKNLPNVVETG